MKITLQNNSKLPFFAALYEAAARENAESQLRYERNRRQYKGDCTVDRSAVPASLVRNITYELIESQVSCDLPAPAVTPKKADAAHEAGARSIEMLLRDKRNELPFERQNDLDERFSPIYGGSVWLVEWDENIVTPSGNGDVRITCLPPRRFIGQPGICEIADMDYCFLVFEASRADIQTRYGVTLSAPDEKDDGIAELILCYYRDEAGNVCRYIWSGDTELCDQPDFYARKHKVCRKCGKEEGVCTCEKPDFTLQSMTHETVQTDILTQNGTVIAAGTLLPYYRPHSFPIVIRRNTSEEDALFGQSDCEFIRPQQQAINKIESRIAEKVFGGGVYPLVPDDFEGELDNSVFRRVFRCNEHNKEQFGTVDLEADIEQDMKEADRLYEHAKRILGISDTYLGLSDSTAQSGKAKQIQVEQAAGRLASKKQMKNAAYADMDRLIFGFYLAFADEPRPGVYLDADGVRRGTVFSRYDFLCRDETGQYYYDDGYLFACSSTETMTGESVWEQMRSNFTAGVYGNPDTTEARLLFWQSMEKARYPYAHENAEHLRAVRAQETAAAERG